MEKRDKKHLEAENKNKERYILAEGQLTLIFPKVTYKILITKHGLSLISLN